MSDSQYCCGNGTALADMGIVAVVGYAVGVFVQDADTF